MAWIIVDIGERAWSQLAYQFGHELGHVLANSWQPHAKPTSPCQWLEEAMVEAFSLRGLGRLAESWKQNPPFPDDHAFGNSITEYRENTQRYAKLVQISHDAIKAQTASAQIILAGLATKKDPNVYTFLNELYTVSGIKNDFDVAAQHPYGSTQDQIRTELCG